MGPVVGPFARGGDPFAGRNRRGMAHRGDEVALAAGLDTEHAEAGLGVVEGHPARRGRPAPRGRGLWSPSLAGHAGPGGARSRLWGIVRADASEGTMSRPVPIVPEVLLLGTLPNPGDLERSIRLQLTPGSGPAPEMAMAAAGVPGRAGRLRGPGGPLGLRPRHRRRPRRLGPVDGSVGGRAGAGADAAGEATGFRERRRIGVSELQRRTLHPAEPARPRRRGRPGGRAVRPGRRSTWSTTLQSCAYNAFIACTIAYAQL